MLLRVLNGPLAGQTFELKEGVNIVGRSSECDICINLPGISKRHAKIENVQGRLTITDLESSNGTFINGIRIRQRELKATDRVGIHQFLIDFKAQKKEQTGFSQIPSWEGNAALQTPMSAPETHAPPAGPAIVANPKNFFETVQSYIDIVAMPGIYRLIEMFEFKNVIGSMILAFVLLMTAFSVVPMINITKSSVEKESRRRALTIAKNLAISNQSLLQQGTESAVSTRAAENEEGVQNALIISNRDGHTIAPLTNAGSYANLPFVHKARKYNREAVEQIDDGLIGASYPIYAYNPDAGQQVIAHAVVLYNMGSLAIDSERYISLFTQMLLISLAMGACLFFLILKLHQQPLVDMNKQLDEALKDDRKSIVPKYMIPELSQLAVNISSALTRASAGGGSSTPRVDRTHEAQNIVQMMANPAMTLDKDRLMLSINTTLEDLIGMRLATLQGQSLEMLSDQALKMSIVDLLDQSVSQPGMIMSNQLDFAGIPYEIDVQAILGVTEIAYYLVCMKRREENL